MSRLSSSKDFSVVISGLPSCYNETSVQHAIIKPALNGIDILDIKLNKGENSVTFKVESEFDANQIIGKINNKSLLDNLLKAKLISNKKLLVNNFVKMEMNTVYFMLPKYDPSEIPQLRSFCRNVVEFKLSKIYPNSKTCSGYARFQTKRDAEFFLSSREGPFRERILQENLLCVTNLQLTYDESMVGQLFGVDEDCIKRHSFQNGELYWPIYLMKNKDNSNFDSLNKFIQNINNNKSISGLIPLLFPFNSVFGYKSSITNFENELFKEGNLNSIKCILTSEKGRADVIANLKDISDFCTQFGKICYIKEFVNDGSEFVVTFQSSVDADTFLRDESMLSKSTVTAKKEKKTVQYSVFKERYSKVQKHDDEMSVRTRWTKKNSSFKKGKNNESDNENDEDDFKWDDDSDDSKDSTSSSSSDDKPQKHNKVVFRKAKSEFRKPPPKKKPAQSQRPFQKKNQNDDSEYKWDD